MRFFLLLLLLALWTFPVFAEETSRELDKIEAELKSKPDDPMLHYQKCQLLFAQGKEQEAIDHAQSALEKFKAAKEDLAWMRLGSFKTDKYRIDVHYNMGPKERAEKKQGIVRPYSFRIWSTDPKPMLIQVLDFELGYSNGKPLTAAIGESTKDGHANYGILNPKSDFATVKKRILEIVQQP